MHRCMEVNAYAYVNVWILCSLLCQGACGGVAPVQPPPFLNSRHYTLLYRAVNSKPDITMDAVMQLMDWLSPEQQHECLQLFSSQGLSKNQF